MIIATAAWFVFTWIEFSVPDGYERFFWFWLVGWLVLTVLWLGLALLFFRVRSSPWGPWLHLPVFLGLTFLVLSLRLPLWLSYFVSRPAMDNVAHAVIAGKQDPSKIHWIGVYRVTEAKRTSRGFAFVIRNDDLGVESGELAFLYADPSPRVPYANDWSDCVYSHLSHMSGHWFEFRFVPCM